jgi:hypothetical protein
MPVVSTEIVVSALHLTALPSPLPQAAAPMSTLAQLLDVSNAMGVPEVLAVKPLPEVIAGLRNWVMGILAAVASLFLAVAGLRYVGSGGDPAVVEQAKANFKAALVGYALAVLSPVFLQIVQGILGG